MQWLALVIRALIATGSRVLDERIARNSAKRADRARKRKIPVRFLDSPREGEDSDANKE
jgi:hypothetical protein